MCDLLFFMFLLRKNNNKMCLECVEMDIWRKIGEIIYIQSDDLKCLYYQYIQAWDIHFLYLLTKLL